MLITLFAVFQCFLLALAIAWPWVHAPELVLSTRIGYSAVALILMAPPVGMTLLWGCSCEPFMWSITATIYCFVTLYRLSHLSDFEEDCAQAFPVCMAQGTCCAFIDTLINALSACCFIMAASLCLCNCSSVYDMILYSGIWCYRIYYWLPRY